MRSSLKKMQGATLLEVMLVLAIAAMIIVMSIRYYQTAQQNQQANAFVSQIQAIVAAADSMATATGSYTGVISTAAMSAMLPAGGLMTPWGTAITVTATSTNVVTIATPTVPVNVCGLALPKIRANSKFANTAATIPAGCQSIVYNSSL